MAVQPQTPYKEYTANGVTTVFPLEFDCENKDHLIVMIDDAETDNSTWSLNNKQVTFNAAPSAGKKITLQRNTPFRRDRNYQAYDNSFRPGPVNDDFDLIWWKLQEVWVKITLLWGALNSKVSAIWYAINNEVKSRIDGDNEIRAWVQVLLNNIIDHGLVSAVAVTTIESIDDLQSLIKWEGRTIYVKSYRAGCSTGGGNFIYKSSKKNINDSIVNFNGWVRQLNGYVTPEMGGAFANLIESDSPYFDRALEFAKENSLEVLLPSTNYLIESTVTVPMGTSYGSGGTVLRGKGKSKTNIVIKNGIDGFNLTNATQLTFSTNVVIEDISFIQQDASRTSIALKTDSNITNLILNNLSFFELKQPIKFDKQFYIARLTSLHSQGCMNGFKFGREGTTLFIDNCFVANGGDSMNELDTVAIGFDINASYSVIGTLACDGFEGVSYRLGWGQYSIGCLGMEVLRKSATNNIIFDHINASIANIEMVYVDELDESNTVIYLNDSKVQIDAINTSNSLDISPAKLIESFASNIQVGAVTGETVFSKPFYDPDIQGSSHGVQIRNFNYQHGDQRPFIGLGNSNLPDQLTSHENPCKQSIFFDIYGNSFFASGYSGEQSWQWFSAPKLGDWGIQRRPEKFGIAGVVSLKDGGIVNDMGVLDVAVLPMISFTKATTPAEGAMYIDKTTDELSIYINNSWRKISLI